MESETQRTVSQLFSGWFEIISLFIILLCALLLLGWSFSRKAKVRDRGTMLPWQLLVPSFGLTLILTYLDGSLLHAIVIAVSMIVAALIAGGSEKGPLYICAMVFATLLGIGQILSAILFCLTAVLVLLVFPFSR